MWNKLSFNHKKALLFGLLFMMLCIAYHFSFRNAMEVVKLNRQLTRQELETQHLDTAYPQVKNREAFYSNIIKLYKINDNDQENRLWQAVSGIALAKAVKISFTPPNESSLNDIVADSNQVFRHEFYFKGNYYGCISLLDSLSKTRGLGIISNLKLLAPKENTIDHNLLSLKLNLSCTIK